MATTVPIATCSPHNDESNYVVSPAPGRPDHEMITCRVCKKWLGYRKIEVVKTTPSRKRKKQNA